MKSTDDITRRRFLGQGMQSATVAMVGTPALSLLASCGLSSSTPGSNAGPATAISNSSNNIYTLSFSQFAALQNSGGSVHISVAATSGQQDLFVTRVSSTSVVAVSTVCTHQGCTLNTFDSNAQQYACPCHGSVFNANGGVVTGPANQALQSFSGTISGSGVQLTIP